MRKSAEIAQGDMHPDPDNDRSAPACDSQPSHRALVVKHHFPEGPGGRVEKLVRYLPDFGVQPLALSAESPDPGKRQALLEELYPEALRAYEARIRGPSYFSSRFLARGPEAENYKLLSLLSFPERCVYVPDNMIRWIAGGKRIADMLAKKQEIDCVFTSSPRESTHLIGLHLSTRHGIPWIADFRDLWTRKSLAYRPATPVHDRMIRRLEEKVMRTADHIVANTEENKQSYIQDFNLASEKISVIPNGFDRDDLPGSSTKLLTGRKFRVGHMGSLTKTSYPWKLFLDALAKLADEVGAANVEFVHCGNHIGDLDRYVASQNMQDIFSFHGKLDHRDAMKLMAETDVHLVLLYENDDSHTLVPQKLYNYLILGGPVLAIAPEVGGVARVVRETSAGFVVSPTRGVDAVYDVLRRCYDEWSASGVLHGADGSRIDRYDRRSQAGQIARIIKQISPGIR